MATINIFNTFNRFYTLDYKFKNGIVLGMVLSEDHSEENLLINHSQEIINAMKCHDIDPDDDYFINVYVDGMYNFIACIINMSDEDDWEYFKKIPTCKALANIKKRSINYSSYCRFKRDTFVDTVEEKNFLQKLFSIMGWRMFDYPTNEDFIYDAFYQAFEKACLEYNGGRVYTQIPNAETIFRVYNKCLKRWNVEEEEKEEA